MEYLLEIAAFSLAGAQTAQAEGAHRIELCENPADGGTTPSYGTLLAARKYIRIPVFPIIRPRPGDFFYSKEEYEVMTQDLLLCKILGFEGIVTGILQKDGQVDYDRMARLVERAYPMEVTFHRAFDRCAEPLEALNHIVQCGCQRILTSGQFPTAMEGALLIKQLVDQAGDRIIIMPGSGINAGNIAELAQQTGAAEFHASARASTPSLMDFEVKTMQESLTFMQVNASEVSGMLAALQSLS